MSTRIVGVSRGDPFSPLAASGVAANLFDALDRRYDVVARVDVSLRQWQRAVAAGAAFHPDRVVWRERFYRHRLAWELQSQNARGSLPPRSRYDLAIQVFALFQTRGAPYMIDIDTTHALSRASWPGWSPFPERYAQRWLALERRTYHAAAHLFARTTAVATSLVDDFGVPRERVTVVAGGAPLARLPESPLAGERDPVILFVGREWERKGGDVLVEAFRLLRRTSPHVRLQVVGTQEPAPEPGIEILGRIDDRAELERLYARASVFCLPSRYEPFSGAVMEAMAYGLPTVVADSGGMADVVDHGRAGVLVPPGDAGALMTALRQLLEHPESARRLGAAGRERVEKELNWDAVVGRMAPAIDAFVAGELAGSPTPGGR